MSSIRKHVTLSNVAGVAVFLLVIAAGASSLIVARSVGAAPVVASPTAFGEAQLELADSVCEASAVEPSASKKPCHNPCPDKPYCTCTYNGQPRVSCDPCCYQTYTGWICLD